MATKKPLVISNGIVQQLQSGDTLEAAQATVNVQTFTNGESSAALVIGTPVYVSAAGTVKRAQANALSTADVIGLWRAISTAAAGSDQAVLDGVLVATTGQWDAVTGQSGGLTPGARYYLDPSTPGKLSTTAPTTTGQVVVGCGLAISTTEMEVDIETFVLL